MRDGWWRSYRIVVVPIAGMVVIAGFAVAQRRRSPQPPSSKTGESSAASTGGDSGQLVGPEPEIHQSARPTPADVAAMLAPNFDEPRLLEVRESEAWPPRDAHDVIVWTLRYDGIDLDHDVRSGERHPGDWATVWHPIRRSPPRWRHAEALSDASAREHAHVASNATVRRLFHDNYVMQFKGPAHAAEDVVLAVGSFSPAIEVMGADGYGALIDAYTGAVLAKRSNWIQ